MVFLSQGLEVVALVFSRISMTLLSGGRLQVIPHPPSFVSIRLLEVDSAVSQPTHRSGFALLCKLFYVNRILACTAPGLQLWSQRRHRRRLVCVLHGPDVVGRCMRGRVWTIVVNALPMSDRTLLGLISMFCLFIAASMTYLQKKH